MTRRRRRWPVLLRINHAIHRQPHVRIVYPPPLQRAAFIAGAHYGYTIRPHPDAARAFDAEAARRYR